MTAVADDLKSLSIILATSMTARLGNALFPLWEILQILYCHPTFRKM